MSRKRNRVRNVSPGSPLTAADAKAQEVQNEIAMDSFANPAANLGWGAENLTEGTEYPLTRLTQNYMLRLSLYRSSGILKRIVNKPVEDAVAHWFKIESQITPDQIDAFNRLQRRTKIKANIEKGLKWGRLFGGAAGLIMIDGQGDILDQPLDLNTVEPDSFKGIYIVDRWSGLYPGDRLVDDPGSPAFGLPEFYHIRENENATSDVKVHYSRVLRFSGDELPYWEKQVEQMWGTSVVETIWDSLRRYDNALGNVANLIWQANIWTHKMQGANNLFGTGTTQMQQNVVNSIHAQRALMNSFGERILDTDDDLQNHPYSFAGLDRVFSIFQYDMSSVSGIPITILFGRSAAGLDATGDADLDNYYTMLEGIQENKIRPVLEQLVPVMCMSEFGAVPDDVDISFNPVRVPTEKEKAEIAASKTTAVVQAHTEGIINDQIAMKELHAMSDSTGMFSNITDEDIENADQKPDAGDIPPGMEEMLQGASGEPAEGEQEKPAAGGRKAPADIGQEKLREAAADSFACDDKPSVEEIRAAAEKYQPDYKIVAVRTQDVPFEPGRIKHRSERWSDGEPTGRPLDGLSCTSVRSSAVRKHTPEFDPREGQYQGDYVAVIGGNRYHAGHDKGEVVIKDPAVLEILRPNEAFDFDESKHPRGGKGTEKGGQFVRKDLQNSGNSGKIKQSNIVGRRASGGEENGSAEGTGNTGVAEETGPEEPAHPGTGEVGQPTGPKGARRSSAQMGRSAGSSGEAYTAREEFKRNLRSGRRFLVRPRKVSADEFSASMRETITQNLKFFATVDYHEPADLKQAQCFLGSGADDRGAGYFGSVVKPNGDITGVFNGDGHDGGKEAMLAAIRNGGDRGDAYAVSNETGEPNRLARFYAKFGLVPVARVPFNPEYAAPGVEPQDIVFYIRNGDSAETVAQKYGTYPPPTKEQYDALPVMSYEEARKYRDDLISGNKRK